MENFRSTYGHYELDSTKERLDIDVIERLLRTSYWASERPRETILRSIEESLCFGLYDLEAERQIGFTRVVSDLATFAWLCDVILDENYRGSGLGKWMVAQVLDVPELQNLKRFLLATRDAHALYSRFGFQPLQNATRWMEKRF